MDDEFVSDMKHDSEIVSDMLKSIKLGIDALKAWQEGGRKRDVEVELMMFGDVADRLNEPYKDSTGLDRGDGEDNAESCAEAIFRDDGDDIVDELESISEVIEQDVLNEEETVSDEQITSVIADASDVGNRMNTFIKNN